MDAKLDDVSLEDQVALLSAERDTYALKWKAALEQVDVLTREHRQISAEASRIAAMYRAHHMAYKALHDALSDLVERDYEHSVQVVHANALRHILDINPVPHFEADHFAFGHDEIESMEQSSAVHYNCIRDYYEAVAIALSGALAEARKGKRENEDESLLVLSGHSVNGYL